MTIGQVAKQVGIRASAIRFYEKAGLIPKPLRSGGRRSYDETVLDLLAVLEHAKACGFTLAETRLLFNGFRAEPHLSERWQKLARQKMRELDALTARITAMKDLLERIQACRCTDLYQCGRAMLLRH